MVRYPFIAVPQAFWDPGMPYYHLSIEAKVTLSKLLQLHEIAKWHNPPQVDEKGKVYVIFSSSQVQSLVGCKADKAGKILKILADQGYIHRIHQGQGKPDKIYVQDLDLGSIRHDDKTISQCPNPAMYRKQLEIQINYNKLTAEFGFDIIDGIVNVIIDKLQTQNKIVTIAQNQYDGCYFRQRLLETQEEHIRYVIRRLRGLKDEPYAPSAYILTRLWEAYDGATVIQYDNKSSYIADYNMTQTYRWTAEEIDEIRRSVLGDVYYGDSF